MARRRMITLDIYDSDNFLDMPTEAQNLFTHFVARADDDGFISNPKRIRRMLGYGEDSFTLLIAKGYIYEFTSGFVVVAAWRSMNRVEPSKKTQTTAKYELAQLTEVNKIYELAENADIEAFTDDTRKILESRGLTSRKVLAQVRLGKDSVVQVSQGKSFGDDDNNQINQNTREKDIDAVLKKANEVFGNLNGAQVHALENLYRRYETSPGLLMDAIIKMANNDIANISYLTKTAETLYQEEQAMLNTIRTE